MFRVTQADLYSARSIAIRRLSTTCVLARDIDPCILPRSRELLHKLGVCLREESEDAPLVSMPKSGQQLFLSVGARHAQLSLSDVNTWEVVKLF